MVLEKGRHQAGSSGESFPFSNTIQFIHPLTVNTLRVFVARGYTSSSCIHLSLHLHHSTLCPYVCILWCVALNRSHVVQAMVVVTSRTSHGSIHSHAMNVVVEVS
jgi:hypothetical protein